MSEQRSITIGIWVYAALPRLQRTVESIQRHTSTPYNLVLLLDGLNIATGTALARCQGWTPLATDRVLGAPACFNRLISYDQADVVVFLESGSLVTRGWLEKLLDALYADTSHGLAGPSTNRAWNEQRLPHPPKDEAVDQVIEAYAAWVVQCYQGGTHPLQPLHSLADFCYAVKREVIETIGGADEAYGTGPCWEMDYNIRAARAGFKGIWVCGAYVHRQPVAPQRVQEETHLLDANKQRYQNKFCRLQLENTRRDSCRHCEGDACDYFAPQDLIQLQIPLLDPGTTIHDTTEPPPPSGPPQSSHHVLTTAHPTRHIVPQATPPHPQSLPLVSCIMPTYNRRPFLAQAIAYFLRQDYPNRELIIVDDGTDPIGDLVPDNPYMRYIRLAPRRTIGAKRNLACEAAKGEIIVHWDDDDWMAPWRLRYQVENLLKEQADICGLAQVLYCAPRVEKAWQYIYPAGDRPWVAGNTLCYTKAFWQYNPFPDINVGEDTRFVWSNRTKRIVALQDSTFYVAVIHADNISPKHTTDRRWHVYPLADMRNLLGEDWAFYVELLQPASEARDHERPRRAVRREASLDVPLVSCIMPTYNRRRFVPQAITYFLRQDYPNRELIIVDDGTDPVRDLIPEDPYVHYLRLPTKHSIGAKRNLACEAAKGTVILCWDDDDWYAPHRISYQVAPLLEDKADITGLDKSLLFSLPTQQFWTCTSHLHARLFVQAVVGGTLAFWKKLWGNSTRFPHTSLAEDAAFLQSLIRRGARLARLANDGIFIYVRHDNNSWRFTLGNFLDNTGWQQVMPPSFLPESDCAFYGIRRQTACTH
jgi:O-antigen biosynthesis protein